MKPYWKNLNETLLKTNETLLKKLNETILKTNETLSSKHLMVQTLESSSACSELIPTSQFIHLQIRVPGSLPRALFISLTQSTM